MPFNISKEVIHTVKNPTYILFEKNILFIQLFNMKKFVEIMMTLS